MKKINSLRLLIVLVAVGLMPGCDDIKYFIFMQSAVVYRQFEGNECLTIDGVQYDTFFVRRTATNGEYRGSFVFICPRDQSSRYPRDINSDNEYITSWEYTDKESGNVFTDLAVEAIYYVNNGKIEFSQTYEELGLGATEVCISEEKLKETITKLIRENITPQEEKE